MKTQSAIVLLISLILSENYGLANAASSKSKFISGLQWSSVGTFIKTKGRVWHLEEDVFVAGNILFADESTLMTTNGKATDLIVGSSFGYAEGRSSQAQFDLISGFLQTNSSHVLVVDNGNHCLRFVSRTTNLTSPFVGTCTSPGPNEIHSLRFRNPWSVIANPNIPGSAIVTDTRNNNLRVINVTSGQVIPNSMLYVGGQPYDAVFSSDNENIFVIFSDYLGMLNVKTNRFIRLTPVETRDSSTADGLFVKPIFGDARGLLCVNQICLVADHRFNKLNIVDLNEKTISSICPSTSTSIDGPAGNCTLRNPGGLLLKSDTLYIGESGAIRIITGNNYCTINPCRNSGQCITVKDSFTCSCMAGWTGILCEKEFDACQNTPCLNSGICAAGDNKTYTCACREGWTGKDCQTEINACTFNPCKNSGKCLARNNTFTCSCIVGWTGATCEMEIQNATCKKEILATGDPVSRKAKIILPDGDKLMLPVGKYIYEKRLPDSATCEIEVLVSDPRLKVRLDVSANYKLACSLFNDFKELTHSIALSRYSHVNQLSSGSCNQPAEDIEISCAKDVLQVIWPTDCLFDSGLTKENKRILSIFDENLSKTKQVLLDLVIPTRKPPIIQPSLNQKGLIANVVLTPVCSDGLKYQNGTDTCQ